MAFFSVSLSVTIRSWFSFEIIYLNRSRIFITDSPPFRRNRHTFRPRPPNRPEIILSQMTDDCRELKLFLSCRRKQLVQRSMFFSSRSLTLQRVFATRNSHIRLKSSKDRPDTLYTSPECFYASIIHPAGEKKITKALSARPGDATDGTRVTWTFENLKLTAFPTKRMLIAGCGSSFCADLNNWCFGGEGAIWTSLPLVRAIRCEGRFFWTRDVRQTD